MKSPAFALIEAGFTHEKRLVRTNEMLAGEDVEILDLSLVQIELFTYLGQVSTLHLLNSFYFFLFIFNHKFLGCSVYLLPPSK